MSTTIQPIIASGVIPQPGQKAWYNRVEIFDFANNPVYKMQWSLYVQALWEMYKAPDSSDSSYYQLAGIHGAPYVPWNGAGNVGLTERQGYCTHGTVVFPTWHRPYVALFEQTLQSHAIAIAQRDYTGAFQAQWMDAAVQLRQPYWDWIVNPLPPTQIYKDAKVTITNPAGKDVPVDNPFLFYTFKSPDSYKTFPKAYSNWTRTARHAVLQSDGQLLEDIADLETTVTAGRKNRAMQAFTILTGVFAWDKFTNNQDTSMENLHNSIHFAVGRGRTGANGGDMSDNAVAAFDPIFWLHHSQTDRLIAMWEAMNPSVWVSDGTDPTGTFSFAPNSAVTQTTNLTPFWRSSGPTNSTADAQYWNSTHIRGHLAFQPLFGYSYPDFDKFDRNDLDKAGLKQAVSDYIQTTYLPIIMGKVTTTVARPPPSPGPAPLDARPTTPTPPPQFIWTAHVSVKKYALGTSFAVSVFVGAVPDDPRTWDAAPSFAGEFYTVVNGSTPACPNCVAQNAAGLVVSGPVYLNDALERYVPGVVRSLEPEDVLPLLARELRWRVADANGNGALVHPSAVDGLEVRVSVRSMEWPEHADAPMWGESRVFEEITRGRPGGIPA